MKNILGYVRVSSSKQDLGPQINRLNKIGCIRIFEDVISGKVFDRPGLKSLINYTRKGDVLCVVRLDRLGRSLKELLSTIEMLKSHNIGFMSLEENIDTTSAAGELIFHVFGAIAHFERRLITERTKDGIELAKQRGKYPGRPALDKAKLDAAIKLINSGMPKAQAAKSVAIGRSTLYRELKLINLEI